MILGIRAEHKLVKNVFRCQKYSTTVINANWKYGLTCHMYVTDPLRIDLL